ncbi:hypothetical protein E3N88_13238 [Mikania micrantha]|uniref:Uncharacterized protein n=1 Tax=Mikania micrantha TaxID=192012 RepID=A0A5N6P940_9ASTR|nr:hypothetical protein E3N88_13238 [Mikania micrantha]
MADQGERYIYQRFPYVILDDTPSSSSGSDSDPLEASATASQADAPEPAPEPAPMPSPPRVPAWDGLRRMRGQARKTTGLPIRRQMAPRDEPDTGVELGAQSLETHSRVYEK